MSKRLPYICVTKSLPHTLGCKTWCGRNITLGGETSYYLAFALHKQDEITCPSCLSEITIAASVPPIRPTPKLGCLEVVLPFIGMGIFMFGVVLGKPPSVYDFFSCIFPILCTSILVIMYGTCRIFRLPREADKIGQENLAALLGQSPNAPK